MIKGINERNENGGFIVYINDKILSPKRSQKVRNHSPDGFAWGYGGSGPSQLALALLLEFTTQEEAQINYMDFKFEIIANLPKDFELEEKVIINWLKNRRKYE